jgi:chaperonin cofactor prefoldin
MQHCACHFKVVICIKNIINNVIVKLQVGNMLQEHYTNATHVTRTLQECWETLKKRRKCLLDVEKKSRTSSRCLNEQ